MSEKTMTEENEQQPGSRQQWETGVEAVPVRNFSIGVVNMAMRGMAAVVACTLILHSRYDERRWWRMKRRWGRRVREAVEGVKVGPASWCLYQGEQAEGEEAGGCDPRRSDDCSDAHR